MSTKERVTISTNPEEFIKKTIAKIVRDNHSNRRKLDGGKYWDAPLVGFASADDPLFQQYRKNYREIPPYTSGDLLSQLWKGEKHSESVCYLLGSSCFEDSRKSNRKQNKYPSLLWAHTRDLENNST